MESVNTREFEAILSSNELVVADFYTDWCMPCKMLSPVLDEISVDYPQITFCKVNVDANEDLARKYSIDFIPNVIFFKNSQKKSSFTGFKTKEQLKELFDNFLG